jgi:hypothetical protein
MLNNPYEPSTARGAAAAPFETAADGKPISTGIKYTLMLMGMLLYFSNVQRDAHFFRTILENEGFPTTHDSIAVGIAGSVLSTFVLTPVALFLICYGFGNCKRLQIVPSFHQFTMGWGIATSILSFLMVMIEVDHLIYAIQRPQHWRTLLASALYVGYIYVWWCCSLAHGEKRTNSTIHRHSRVAGS